MSRTETLAQPGEEASARQRNHLEGVTARWLMLRRVWVCSVRWRKHNLAENSLRQILFGGTKAHIIWLWFLLCNFQSQSSSNFTGTLRLLNVSIYDSLSSEISGWTLSHMLRLISSSCYCARNINDICFPPRGRLPCKDLSVTRDLRELYSNTGVGSQDVLLSSSVVDQGQIGEHHCWATSWVPVQSVWPLTESANREKGDLSESPTERFIFLQNSQRQVLH